MQLAEADEPVSFGPRSSWLAIRNAKPEAVVSALSLADVRKSGWKKGIEAAYEGEVFVTPEINGWVLAASSFSFPAISDGTGKDHFTPFITALGQRFPDVQYFVTQRTVGYQAWARVVNGKLVREYAFLGESGKVLANRGGISDEEKKLGIVVTGPMGPNEQDVMDLAAAWSIDPTSLERLNLGKSIGLLGSYDKK